jgi:hypothetical protein
MSAMMMASMVSTMLAMEASSDLTPPAGLEGDCAGRA